MLSLFRQGLQGGSAAALPALQQLVRSMAAAAGAAGGGAAPAAKPVVEREFLIYRWNPDSAEPPKYDSYKVDINA